MAGRSNNRIDYVDLFRGIGIILMVFGHMKFIDVLGFDHFYHIIHAFHMPMFFFLAGYCYKRSDTDLKITILKKAKRLLIPYIIFGMSEYVLWRLFEGDSWEPLIHLFGVNTEGLAIAGALWFLTALFIASVFYAVADRYIHKTWILTVVCLFIAIIGCIIPRLLSFRLPYATDAAMVGIGFIHIGRLARYGADNKYVSIIQNLKIWQVLLLIIPNTVLIMYNDGINMRTGRYANIALFWLNALVSIYIGLSLCRSIKSAGVISERIKRIGRNGIVYVCINELVITVFARILNRFISASVVYNILLVILVFAGLWIAETILTQTPLRVFLGYERVRK